MISIYHDDIIVGAQPIGFIVARKKIKKWSCEVVVAFLRGNTYFLYQRFGDELINSIRRW